MIKIPKPKNPITALRNEITGLRKRIDGYVEDVNNLNRKVADLGNEVAEWKRLYEDGKKELSKQAKDLGNEINDWKDKARKLGEEVQNSAKSLDDIFKEAKKVYAGLSTFELDLASLASDTANTKTLIDLFASYGGTVKKGITDVTDAVGQDITGLVNPTQISQFWKAVEQSFNHFATIANAALDLAKEAGKWTDEIHKTLTDQWSAALGPSKAEFKKSVRAIVSLLPKTIPPNGVTPVPIPISSYGNEAIKPLFEVVDLVPNPVWRKVTIRLNLEYYVQIHILLKQIIQNKDVRTGIFVIKNSIQGMQSLWDVSKETIKIEFDPKLTQVLKAKVKGFGNFGVPNAGADAGAGGNVSEGVNIFSISGGLFAVLKNLNDMILAYLDYRQKAAYIDTYPAKGNVA